MFYVQGWIGSEKAAVGIKNGEPTYTYTLCHQLPMIVILKIPLFPDFPNCPPAGLHTLCDYSTAAIVTAFD